MLRDTNTFSACGEMMSGWREAGTAGDQSPISRRLVAKDFRAKVFLKIGRRLINNRSTVW